MDDYLIISHRGNMIVTHELNKMEAWSGLLRMF